jgi:hypothetical protein
VEAIFPTAISSHSNSVGIGSRILGIKPLFSCAAHCLCGVVVQALRAIERDISGMLLLAIICAFGSLILLGWAVKRGEGTDRVPHDPQPRWRLSFGMLLLAGSGLLIVVTLAIPRLAPPTTQTASQPLPAAAEPVSAVQELR